MTALLEITLRSSAVLAAGLLLAAALAKQSAALRHRVLAATLMAAALVAPLNVALPTWQVALPAGPAIAPAPAPTVMPVSVPSTTTAAPSLAPRSSLAKVVVLWLTGSLFFAGALAAGLLRVARLAARASPITDVSWLDAARDISRRYGISRPVRLARTESNHLLATWGVFRPHVLLPAHSSGWSRERLRVVLSHELAHVQRHDWIVQLAAELLRVVLWFNPLVWLACAWLRRESELACDDDVLRGGVSGEDYAGHLLALARRCRRARYSWGAAMPMAHPSTLERRITAMLNPRLNRRAPSVPASIGLGVVLLLVTIPAAAVGARQSGPAPLSGTIYDMSGAVVPGVEVTLVDASQLKVTRSSDAYGRFEFPPVGPGKYRLEAAVPGFRKFRHDLELKDAPDWTRVITLQIGELRETIRVRDSRTAVSPVPATSATQPVRVGGNIRPPKKLKDVKPVYPPAMREAGLTADVQLEAVIGTDGTVSSVRVLSSQVHPDFAIAAADAVRQWRFTPTLLNGQAVEVAMTVGITFDLN